MNSTERSTAGETRATGTNSAICSSEPIDELTTYLLAVGIGRAPVFQHVRIEYCYRCLSGRDHSGETVLANAYHITVPQLTSLLGVLCYDGLYFDAVRCGLPCLVADTPDPDWHELIRISLTDAPCTDGLDVLELLTNLLKQPRPVSFTDCTASKPLHAG